MEIYTFTPDEEQKNLRIDKFLSEQLPDQSRSYLQKLLKEGNVTVNEKTVKATYKVQLSDTVQEARKEIRLCVWISITAVICCAALCALVVLWSR